MATLNTLRTKGGVVVAVVIAISLLAFLLGDLATSGGTLLGSSKMNVGEVNGSVITYNDYLERMNNLTSVQQIVTGQESLNEQQQEATKANAWEQITREHAFDNSLVDLGLLVSDEEAIDMADGEFISPIINQLFANPETGSYDSEALRRYVTTLDEDATGRKRFFWNYIEREMSQERSMSKYVTLVEKAVYANNLEIENAVKATNNSYDIVYVGKALTTVADSTIKVTEADYKKYYDEHKRLFKQTDSREIEYVVFDALPSTDDYKTAETTVQTLAAELTATDDVEQYVNLNSTTKFVNAYLSVAELPANLREFATNGTEVVFGPKLEGDVYTLARIIDSKELPDTVGLRQIVVSAQDQALADSIVTLLKSKAITFEDALAQYSLDKQTPGGELGKISPSQLAGFGDVADKANTSSKGDIFIAKTPYGLHIMENTYKGAMVKKSKIGIVTYNIEPSERTMQESYAKATEFANSAKSDFDKAVEAGAYSKRVARLKAGDNNVSGINQSHEIVRWAFNNKTGDVSEIIGIGESNIIVRVSNSQEHGTTSLAQVKKDILPAIIREKKIELISSELTGSSVEDIASKLGSEVKTASAINFNSYFIPELGIAQEAIGVISMIPENTLSKPVAAGNDVVVLSVTSKQTTDETTFDTQKVVTQTSIETDVLNRLYTAVFNLADIQDSRIKFF